MTITTFGGGSGGGSCNYQRPDDALIREARDRADDLNPIYDKDLITRLADALEQRIAEGVEAYAVRDVADEKRYAAEAEVQRLTTIIQQHNDGQASSCEWRRNTPGSYADYCAAYTGRDRICPDCPRDNMIDVALHP